jgi:hypothetical protein
MYGMRRDGNRVGRAVARAQLTAMAGSSASTSSWGGSGSRGCFLLGEDMDRESGAEDRSDVERTDGESRGSERGRPSSDEGGEESGDEFRLMVSLEKSRGRSEVKTEGGGKAGVSRWRNNRQMCRRARREGATGGVYHHYKCELGYLLCCRSKRVSSENRCTGTLYRATYCEYFLT